MRKLKTSDITAFCRCLKAVGIKNEVQKIAGEANNAKEAWDRGFELIWGVFDLATEREGEQHIYEFLAGPFETTAQAVADMELVDFFAAVKQLADENDLAGFFKSAQAVMR